MAIAGVVIGSGAALLVDRLTGLVFSIDELQALLPCPLLKHLPLSLQRLGACADLLSCGPLATAGSGPIALVPVGDLSADQLQASAANYAVPLQVVN